MSIINQLEKEVKNLIKKSGYEIENFQLLPSNRKDLGDFQINDAMTLAKTYKKSPHLIAEEIVKELSSDSRFININIAGPGFINLSLSNEYLAEVVNTINKDIYENIDTLPPKKVIIDYGGANVSKTLHVGHLRSADIGEALKRLAKLLGYEVLGDAHLGDYGRPLGLIINEIKTMYPTLEYFNENYEGNYEDIDLPITNEDLETIYPKASEKAKLDEKYLEEARQITAKIQQHQKGYYDLWKKIVEISKEDIKKVYRDLNVEFELWFGESDAVEYLDELYKIYEQANVLKQSENAQIIEVKQPTDKAPMPPLLFIKSNGSISYETTDLATIIQRKKEYNPDEIWYCVDGRQELHFEQVFRAARLVKLIADNVKLDFIGFGTMNGPDGKPFKTRDGKVMSLKKLIALVQEATRKKLNPSITDKQEQEEISKKVAIAALKYADFLPFRSTDFIFEVEKFSDLEGKTGPYLLYSTIRIKSLLNKADIDYKTFYTINSTTEKEIILTILNLPKVLLKSLELKSLNEIAEFLYNLTALYNKFYAENKILIEKNQKLKESWLILTKLVFNTNLLLLNVLGINVPEKM